LNVRTVLRVLGFMWLVVGISIIPSALLELWDHSGDFRAMLASAALPALAGTILLFRTRGEVSMHARDGFGIAVFGWLTAAVFGALPFYLSGYAQPADAFFETMSGFTTTGATIFPDVESLPRSLLLWRSLTQWLGGMGIVALSVAVLPLSGGGGMQLMKAEVPGPTADRLAPRIQSTAKILWTIYGGLTAAQTVLLMVGGMNLFEAICHSFCTISTGGFSTRNASIAAYQSVFIESVVIAFMFLSAVNFSLHFGFFQRKRLSVFTANGEFVTYAVITVVATALLVLNLMVRSGAGLGATRPALFQVVSIMTTTGFGTADYVLWGFGAQVVLFALMVVGGSAGSTAGGMKVIRTLLFGKHILRLIRKQIQPQGVFTVKHAGKPVTNDVMMYVLGFIPFYILVAVVVALIVEAMGVAPSTAFGASIATLSNVGPGFGQVGPTSTYAPLPEAAKVILAFGMLLGRLELFTVLVVLTPMFWKRR
jgi:trk system potassium uptake protein TrkH